MASSTKFYGAMQNVGLTTVISDDLATSVSLSSSDGKDYITIDTSDTGETLTLKAGGSSSQEMRIDSNGNVSGPSGSHYKLFARGATDTQPTVVPYAGRTTTGLGSSGADALSLIAGGVEAIRCAKGAGGAAVVQIKDAIHYNAGTGSDTATTEPVYLADTNGTMIVDFSNGNFGDITLAANVTAVKFWNVPADGTTATITAKITQDSSARTFDYGDSAVTVYSDGGSTAVTGEIKFAGGAHHVQSTGSGAVDLVSFTCIPSGSTFNIYAAVIGQAFA